MIFAKYFTEFPTEDGTYVHVNGELVRVESSIGYEIAYASVNMRCEVPGVTLALGETIGVWNNDGTLYVDRTFRVIGPRDLAVEIGCSYNQLAIWDWAKKECIDLEWELSLTH